jgi:hypothetical protein
MARKNQVAGCKIVRYHLRKKGKKSGQYLKEKMYARGQNKQRDAIGVRLDSLGWCNKIIREVY